MFNVIYNIYFFEYLTLKFILYRCIFKLYVQCNWKIIQLILGVINDSETVKNHIIILCIEKLFKIY